MQFISLDAISILIAAIFPAYAFLRTPDSVAGVALRIISILLLLSVTGVIAARILISLRDRRLTLYRAQLHALLAEQHKTPQHPLRAYPLGQRQGQRTAYTTAIALLANLT